MTTDIGRLERALDTIEKQVNISYAGPIPSSLLARQDLEQALVVLSDRWLNASKAVVKSSYIGELQTSNVEDNPEERLIDFYKFLKYI